MKDDDKLSADELALLGALAAGDEPRQAEAALPPDEELAAELASHRALVSELRGLPERAPSPNWRQLEASIRRACDEVPVKKRWWQALREAWRVPTLGIGAAAMASLALLLWMRAPAPVDQPLDAAPLEIVKVQAAERRESPAPARPARSTAMYLDEEIVDDIDERDVDALMQQLPDEAAFALGTAEESSYDEDELLPGGSYDDEIEQLDDEALRALDRWLEAAQKG